MNATHLANNSATLTKHFTQILSWNVRLMGSGLLPLYQINVNVNNSFPYLLTNLFVNIQGKTASIPQFQMISIISALTLPMIQMFLGKLTKL